MVNLMQYHRGKDESYSEWDLLGMSDTKDRMVKVLESITPPLTIGLYGEWGSGKTEIIHAIIDDLRKIQSEETSKEKYLTLYFDAWEYRKEEDIILPVLSSIYNKHLKNIGADVWGKTKNVMKTLGYIGANVATKKLTGGMVDLKDVVSGFEMSEKDCKEYVSYIDEVKNLKENYKELIDLVIENTKTKKIFIFIDNLDRCLPDVVVNLLENISIFLSYQDVKCVYTLAMDKEHVIKAINHLYPDFEGDKYLEKIIHLDLNMPTLINSESGIDAFTLKYKFIMGISRHQDSNLFHHLEKKFNVTEEGINYLNLLFSKGVLSNPRRMNKVIVQMVSFQKNMDLDSDNKLDFYLLLFLISLREFFPAIYFSLEDADIYHMYFMIDNFFEIQVRKKNDISSTDEFQLDKRKRLQEMNNLLLVDKFLNDDFFRLFIKDFASLLKSNLYQETRLCGDLLMIKDLLNKF